MVLVVLGIEPTLGSHTHTYRDLIHVVVPVGHHQETPVVQNDTVHVLEASTSNQDGLNYLLAMGDD